MTGSGLNTSVKEKTAPERRLMRWGIALLSVLLVAIIGVGLCAGYALYKINDKLNYVFKQNDRDYEISMQNSDDISMQNSAIISMQNSAAILMQDSATILSGMMADKTELLIAGKNTDEEIAIAIAEWVAGNISNDYVNTDPAVFEHDIRNDVYGWYASRNGLCGARSAIMLEMLKLAGISAHGYNMYHFPSAPGGHSCIEVWFDDAWHFFDCTYAGYFRVDGRILSFEEVVADPSRALEGLVVFPDTADRNSDGTKVDNYARMASNYDLASLTGLRSYGELSIDNPITVYPKIDFNERELWQFGKEDKDAQDIYDDGYEQSVSCYLSKALRNDSMYAQRTEFEFFGCEPGRRYYIEYHTYSPDKAGLVYRAAPTGAEIAAGETFEPMALSGVDQVWRIEFIPDGDACSVYIDAEGIPQGSRTLLDSIEIGAAE